MRFGHAWLVTYNRRLTHKAATIGRGRRRPMVAAFCAPGMESRIMLKLLKAGALSLAVAGVVAGIVGCNVGEPAPFDPRTLGEGERLSSRDVRTYPMHPLPTTLQSP